MCPLGIPADVTGGLGADVLIISPHSDDAVLSLGAAVARATEAGATVRVLTVLAGDPESTAPASDWDRRCGFGTAGESARARRVEDRVACDLVGATVDWLPWGYSTYERGATDDEVWRAVRDACDSAETVLLPGFPLAHPDHLWLSELLLRRGLRCERVGLYVEQPYAFNRRHRLMPSLPEPLASTVGESVEWIRLPVRVRQRAVKRKAIRAYRSQMRSLGLSLARGRLERMLLYEHRTGGEVVAWLRDGPWLPSPVS